MSEYEHDCWSIERTTTAVNPVTAAEVRAQAGVPTQDDDSLIETYIAAATERAEAICGRALVTATYKLYLDKFPCEIRLPKPPATSVTSIQYIDTGGNTQTLNTSLYTTDLKSEPARIVPAWGQVWPPTRCQPNAVTVTYVAGYSDAASVPAMIRLGIMQIAAHFYEHPEAIADGAKTAVPLAGEMLIESWSHGYIW